MQRDPLGYVDGMNLMEYVGGNTLNYLDPWGTKETQDVKINNKSKLAKKALNEGLKKARMKASPKRRAAAMGAAVLAAAVVYTTTSNNLPNCTKEETEEIMGQAQAIDLELKTNIEVIEDAHKNSRNYIFFYHGTILPGFQVPTKAVGKGDFGRGFYTYNLSHEAKKATNGRKKTAYDGAIERARQKQEKCNSGSFPIVLIYAMKIEDYEKLIPKNYLPGQLWRDYVSRNKQQGMNGKAIDGNQIVVGPIASSPNGIPRANDRLPYQTRFSQKALKYLKLVGIAHAEKSP